MISRDPKCVFVADNSTTAGMICGMLDAAGFPAQVMSEATMGGLEGVTWMAPGVSLKGMEVWVKDAAHIDPAKKFLEEEAKAAQEQKDKRAARTGTITATCEDCGKPSDWPATAMGTTELCPHCQGYMDIPDPDDDWSGVDFGTDEDENDGEKEDKS